MKKFTASDRAELIGEKKFNKDDKKVIAYYFVAPSGEKAYGFEQAYHTSTYNLCKNGIRVNALLKVKNSDHAVMRLVNRTRQIMPYVNEYCCLE